MEIDDWCELTVDEAMIELSEMPTPGLKILFSRLITLDKPGLSVYPDGTRLADLIAKELDNRSTGKPA